MKKIIVGLLLLAASQVHARYHGLFFKPTAALKENVKELFKAIGRADTRYIEEHATDETVFTPITGHIYYSGAYHIDNFTELNAIDYARYAFKKLNPQLMTELTLLLRQAARNNRPARIEELYGAILLGDLRAIEQLANPDTVYTYISQRVGSLFVLGNAFNFTNTCHIFHSEQIATITEILKRKGTNTQNIIKDTLSAGC